MSTSPSPPRNKSRKQPSGDVSLEDLLAAHKTERGPGQLPAEGVVLIGVDLELQRRMAERYSPGGSSPTVAPKSGAPTDLADAPVICAPNIGAPETEFNISELLVRHTGPKSRTVRVIARIEDVFTAAERDLLRWLWERGRPLPMTSRIRLVTGPNGEGARRLAVQAGLIYNTFKNLTRSLSTKFALDIVKPQKNLPAIYAVYDEETILERQKQAGFIGAIHKNGGGRELVDGETRGAPRRPDLTVEELQIVIGAPKFAAPASRAPIPGAEQSVGANYVPERGVRQSSP